MLRTDAVAVRGRCAERVAAFQRPVLGALRGERVESEPPEDTGWDLGVGGEECVVADGEDLGEEGG